MSLSWENVLKFVWSFAIVKICIHGPDIVKRLHAIYNMFLIQAQILMVENRMQPAYTFPLKPDPCQLPSFLGAVILRKQFV